MNDQSFDGTCPTCGQPYLREAQAAAKAYHAELEALKLRVAKAIVTLASAGYWSDFARLALKELRGG